MSPVNVGAIGAYIREQREQAKISLRQLAQSAGISNPYLSQIERGLRRPSADILQQIAKGLRISAEALYVQAGFLEDRPPGSIVRDAVLTDDELSERQKQMLLEVYESFRRESAIARAESGLDDDDSEFSPDEAALTWPENLTPALAARPRRLALAAYREPGDDDEVAADEMVSLLGHGQGPWDAATREPGDLPDDDLSSLSGDGLSEGDVRGAEADGYLDAGGPGEPLADSESGPWQVPDDEDASGTGGTLHQFPSPARQFPPPAGNG